MNYEILVNKENPIDIEYMKDVIEPSLVEINFTRDNDDIFEGCNMKEKMIYLESETAKSWYQLKFFLVNQGIEFDICSGFLSLENQQYKYNSFLKKMV